MKVLLFLEEKMLSLSDRIKRLRLLIEQKMSKVKWPKTQTLLLIALALASVNLILCFLRPWSVISIILFVLALKQLIAHKIAIIIKNGIIYYLPYKLQVVLLRRSIFDFLCDIWFFPNLSIYLKAIITPFITKPTPNEVIKQLSVLDAGKKKVFFTKGIVYILPQSVKKLFLPNTSTLHNKVYNLLGEDQMHEHDNKRENNEELIEIKELYEHQSDVSFMSTVKPEKTVATELNTSKSKENLLIDSFHGSPPSPIKAQQKSKVILSNKIMKQVKFIPGRMSYEWDNKDLYKKYKTQINKQIQRDVSAMSIQHTKHKHNKDNMNSTNFIIKMMLRYKNRYLGAVSYKKLVFVFSLSSVLVLVNLMVSRTNRRLTRKALIFLVYALLLGASGGSLAAIVLKPRKKAKKKDKSTYSTLAK